jgi:hypothetical protein
MPPIGFCTWKLQCLNLKQAQTFESQEVEENASRRNLDNWVGLAKQAGKLGH